MYINKKTNENLGATNLSPSESVTSVAKTPPPYTAEDEKDKNDKKEKKQKKKRKRKKKKKKTETQTKEKKQKQTHQKLGWSFK